MSRLTGACRAGQCNGYAHRFILNDGVVRIDIAWYPDEPADWLASDEFKLTADDDMLRLIEHAYQAGLTSPEEPSLADDTIPLTGGE